jgi:hypothetical protein
MPSEEVKIFLANNSNYSYIRKILIYTVILTGL